MNKVLYLYFNDQILFLECLNNVIFLSDSLLCLLNLIYGMIYAKLFHSVYSSGY